MRIVIASDKFKGSLTASQACDAIARGVANVDSAIEIDRCPMSDGGEGFVESMTRALGGSTITHRVTGPLAELKVNATFGVVGEGAAKSAIIEMSSASGLELLRLEDRNPLYTTTFGVGELIRHACDIGCKTILLGIGGSATCDAGIGCLQACGCHVILSDGQYATDSEPLCARDLSNVQLVKTRRGTSVDGVKIVIACDVTNPLYGPAGAACIYAPQKGASPDDVKLLDTLLQSFARRMNWIDQANMKGAGAAGGIGFGLHAAYGATLERGAEIVINATQLASRIKSAHLVITGEGKLDGQSLYGKTVAGVAGLAKSAGVPCFALAGEVEHCKAMLDVGITSAFSIQTGPGTLEGSKRDAKKLLESASSQLVRAFIAGKGS